MMKMGGLRRQCDGRAILDWRLGSYPCDRESGRSLVLGISGFGRAKGGYPFYRV